jgi:rhodanese-related sulfurtransferase
MRLGDLVPRQDTLITLYDSGEPGDRRAARAEQTLRRLGWTTVAVLGGGMRDWTQSRRPLAHGSNVPSKRFGEELKATAKVPSLSGPELRQWQDQGRPHVVCDIRSPEEYAKSRIPNAVGAFGTDLAALAGDLRVRYVPVVVHCSGRTRSIIACRTLQLLGLKDVYALENGTMGWQLAGFPLERGPGAGVLEPSEASRGYGEDAARRLALEAGATRINTSTLSAWLGERTAGQSNVYAIDVRQVSEYMQGHIPGTIAVPGGLAIQRTDEFVPIRDGHVVFVDRAECRSAMAAYWFRKMGFPHVSFLGAGLEGWAAEGRSVTLGRDRKPLLGWDESSALAKPLDTAELRALRLRDSPRIVNVDTSAQFACGHITGTEWIPYGELEDRVCEMPEEDRRHLVLTCRDGRLATLAAANLAREGLGQARVLTGGIAAWQAAGLPVERNGLTEPHDLVAQPYDAGLEEMRRYLEWELTLTTSASVPQECCHDVRTKAT